MLHPLHLTEQADKLQFKPSHSIFMLVLPTISQAQKFSAEKQEKECEQAYLMGHLHKITSFS